MNLIYDTSIAHLQELVSVAMPTRTTHSIALDYDGEVLIDADILFPNVPLSRFKYTTQISQAELDNIQSLKKLFSNLIMAFNAEDGAHGVSKFRKAA